MDETPAPEAVLRNFNCCFYDDCLDMAAESNWISFTCRNCPLSRKKETTNLKDGKYERRDDTEEEIYF